MSEGDWLADRFEEHRGRLRAIAYRILGSSNDADDAVQEAWLRFSRADVSAVDNLGSWLVTVVSRVCLNMLQARRSRPQSSAAPDLPEPPAPPDESDPEHQALLADSVGWRCWSCSTPSPRPSGSPSSSTTCSRSPSIRSPHRRPQHARDPAAGQPGPRARAAAGDDPAAPVGARRRLPGRGPQRRLRGAADAARPRRRPPRRRPGRQAGRGQRDPGSGTGRRLLQRARAVRAALLDGAAAAVWMPGGRPRVVLAFTTSGQHITAVDAIADPDRIRQLDLVIPGSS